MFSTNVADDLFAELKGLLPKGFSYDSEEHLLLLAYLFFWSDKNETDKGESSLPINIENELFPDLEQKFLRFGWIEFVCNVVPSVVADPSNFSSICRKSEKSPVDLILNTILIRTRLGRQLESYYKRRGHTKIFEEYLIICKEHPHLSSFSEKEFFSFVQSLFLYPLISDEKKLGDVLDDGHYAYEVSRILQSKLRISRLKQLEVCNYFFQNLPNSIGKKKKSLREEDEEKAFLDGFKECIGFGKLPFLSMSEEEVSETVSELCGFLIRTNSLDMACALNIRKRTIADSNSRMTFDNENKNDVLMENSIIFRIFTSNLQTSLIRKPNVIVLYPTPFFVKKWHQCRDLFGIDTSFVLEDENTVELLEKFFFDSKESGANRTDFHFFGSLDELVNRNNSRQDSTVVLVFDRNEGNGPDEKALLDEIDQLSSVYVVSSDPNRKIGNSLFELFLNDHCKNITDFLFLPLGIGGTTPRRKVFWKVSASASNHDTNLVKSDHVLFNGGKSHFIFYDDSSLKRGRLEFLLPSGQKLSRTDVSKFVESSKDKIKRTPAASFLFSPEIVFWYSLAKSAKGAEFRRIEAYVRIPSENVEHTEWTDFSSIKTERLQDSVKHKDPILLTEVEKYLREEYPYSKITIGRDNEQRSLLGEGKENRLRKISIRDVLSEKFQVILEGKNISFRTLIYIYPQLDELLSPKGYCFLKQIAATDFGNNIISYLTSTDIENYLSEREPDLSSESYYWQLNIISIALDFAIKHNHCDENILDNELSESSRNNRSFAQIRSALTKKSFSEDEFVSFFKAVMKKLEAGECLFIGVLIKLLTGLESNIVCSLRWKDYIKVKDYGLYSFLVYSQLTNDGRETKSLTSVDDYRIIPCSSILAEVLKKRYDYLNRKYQGKGVDDFYIINQSRRSRKLTLPIKPTDLDKAVRQIVSEVNIQDVIVSIPDYLEGTKENNLARYQGDILRENFRFWGFHICRFLEDEVMYILGNRKSTTFGIYYCDFTNDYSQFILYTKIRRLDAMLLSAGGSQKLSYSSAIIDDQNPHEFKTVSRNPIQLDCLIASKGRCSTDIRISSNLGFMIKVSDLEKQ